MITYKGKKKKKKKEFCLVWNLALWVWARTLHPFDQKFHGFNQSNLISILSIFKGIIISNIGLNFIIRRQREEVERIEYYLTQYFASGYVEGYKSKVGMVGIVQG